MKKVLCVLLCSVVIVAVFAGLRIGVMPRLMRQADYGMGPLKARQEVDVLFVGSSMFRKGIDSQALSTDGQYAYLLSYNGNQPFTMLLELQDLLDSGVTIDTLFVDMYAYTLTAEPKLSDTRLLQDTSVAFLLSMYRQMRDSGEGGLGTLYEMMVLSNNDMFITWPIAFPMVNRGHVNGSNLAESQGGTAENLETLPLSFGNVELNEVQVESLHSLVRLCADEEIAVVFLETPKYTYLYEGDTYCSIMKRYVAELENYDCVTMISRRTADECGWTAEDGCVIYDFDSDNPDYFTDLIHLSSNGRDALTAVLTDRTKE